MTILLRKDGFSSYLKVKNFTVYSLAKEMNVAPSTIYRITNGERGVGATFIAKLLRAFDLTEDDFGKLFMIKDK